MRGVGIDICDVSRIQNSLEKWGGDFKGRVFTENELKDAAGQATSLAARWAAKEAFAKAIKTGIRGFNMVDVEVFRSENGAPSLVLHGAALKTFEELGGGELHLSLSHEKTLATAIVIWQ